MSILHTVGGNSCVTQLEKVMAIMMHCNWTPPDVAPVVLGVLAHHFQDPQFQGPTARAVFEGEEVRGLNLPL